MRKQLLLKQVLFSKLTHCVYQVNFFCMKCPVKRRVNVIVKKQLLRKKTLKRHTHIFVRSYKYLWFYSKFILFNFIRYLYLPGLVVETSLYLTYIYLYYFYLVHVINYFYLTKINLFISIPYPNQVYDKQKKHFSVMSCVMFIVML